MSSYNLRKNVFTLLELMVVVAILGILTSILLPSLGKAREEGRNAVCKSRLSQMSRAASIYTIDNNEWMVMQQAWRKNSSNNWTEVGFSRILFENMQGEDFSIDNGSEIQARMKSSNYNDFFYCPTFQMKFGAAQEHWRGRGSYSMNQYFRMSNDSDSQRARWRKIGSCDEGKEEPYITCGSQNRTDPNDWKSQAASNQLRYMNWNPEPDSQSMRAGYWHNSKNNSLYVGGEVNTIKPAKGASLQTLIVNWDDLQ